MSTAFANKCNIVDCKLQFSSVQLSGIIQSSAVVQWWSKTFMKPIRAETDNTLEPPHTISCMETTLLIAQSCDLVVLGEGIDENMEGGHF